MTTKRVLLRAPMYGVAGKVVEVSAESRAMKIPVFNQKWTRSVLTGKAHPDFSTIEFRDSWERVGGMEVWTPNGAMEKTECQ
jgi:hypothetical protein